MWSRRANVRKVGMFFAASSADVWHGPETIVNRKMIGFGELNRDLACLKQLFIPLQQKLRQRLERNRLALENL